MAFYSRCFKKAQSFLIRFVFLTPNYNNFSFFKEGIHLSACTPSHRSC